MTETLPTVGSISINGDQASIIFKVDGSFEVSSNDGELKQALEKDFEHAILTDDSLGDPADGVYGAAFLHRYAKGIESMSPKVQLEKQPDDEPDAIYWILYPLLDDKSWGVLSSHLNIRLLLGKTTWPTRNRLPKRGCVASLKTSWLSAHNSARTAKQSKSW